MTEYTRTYTWNDSVLPMDGLDEKNGLDVLRAAVEKRRRSPIMETLDIDLVHVEEGQAVLTCEPHPFLANQVGFIHGGVAATLLDSAASAAVHTVLGPGDAYTTISLATTYNRPITPDTGMLTCEGSVLNQGRTLVTALAELHDGRHRLLGHAVANLLVSRRG